MFNPKVSIIIPVYNGSNYLSEAVDSALSQTYGNLEVIVVNDGSSDAGATEKIALSYGDRIRYFTKSNWGVATALNLAIEKSEGQYISWLSHDDVYFPNKISRQIEFLRTTEEQCDNIILSSDINIIDENSQFKETYHFNYLSDNILFDLLLRWVINGCTLLIPKIAFEKFGGFDPSLKTTQDYHLWFRFIKGGFRFIHMSEVLVKSRVHAEQDSQMKIDITIKERRELENFVFSIFSAKDFAESIHFSGNPKILFLKIKMALFFKRAIPQLSHWTKKIGVYDFIAPLYIRYVLKK